MKAFASHMKLSKPLSIVAIMVAACLLALSAVFIGLVSLLVALADSDGGSWHGISGWFLVLVVVPYAFAMLAGAISAISAPIALAMLVNEKPARTSQNLFVAGFGLLLASGWLIWVLSRFTR